MQTLPNLHYEDLIHPSSPAAHWLDDATYIVRMLSPDEHLPFLVQLFVNLERAGVRLDQHLDCLVEALVMEGEG